MNNINNNNNRIIDMKNVAQANNLCKQSNQIFNSLTGDEYRKTVHWKYIVCAKFKSCFSSCPFCGKEIKNGSELLIFYADKDVKRSNETIDDLKVICQECLKKHNRH